jgi:dUTP pyrophosphatase
MADIDTNKLTSAFEELGEMTEIPDNEEIKKQLHESRDLIKANFGLDLTEEQILQIGALFALEDDQFEIISELFLQELKKSINNPADKIAFCQSLNLQNIKVEDLRALSTQWEKAFENMQDVPMSELKISFIKKVISVFINAAMDTQGISKRIISIPYTAVDGAQVPAYAHETDAGADVFALEDVTLEPGETKIVRTGISVQIPQGYEIQVRPRSGLSARSKLRIANTPGTLDSGYRGEVGIICENIDSKVRDVKIDYVDGKPVLLGVDYGSPITIEKGQKIAQLVLSEVPTMHFVKVAALDTENDREGGFGSTGK